MEQPLSRGNTILVDRVEQPAGDRVVRTMRIPPRLPLDGDPNQRLVQRSRVLARFLQCEVAMPVPRSSHGPIPQPPVMTVCEKMARTR
jgi:hypothetical protein